MKEISLTQGLVAIVDDSDYEYLILFKWHARKQYNTFYAGSALGTRNGRALMHRFILNVYDPKISVDHKDGNTLNNQRDNLRICNHAQNQHNRGSNKNTSSKYVGVYKCSAKNTYKALIKVNGKKLHLGTFPGTKEGEILAAKSRDEAAIKYFGEFARLNFKANPNQ